MSMNIAILVGNVGRDAEIRTTQSGGKIANFSIATSETWRDKATGERRESVEWHNIVVFNEKLAEIAEKYVRKGGRIGIQGAIKTREYQDRDGNTRKTTEIVIGNFKGELNLLGSPQGAARDEHGYGQTRSRDSGNGYGDAKSGRSASDSAQGKNAPLDDDIPF